MEGAATTKAGDATALTVGLPAALAVVMFGLGLALTPASFVDVLRRPWAIVIILVVQLVCLPALCFGLVLLLHVPATLSVGMILLSAAPGGPTASIFSRLFRGNVAWNISLTTINSLLSIITVPITVNLAIRYFTPGAETLNAQSSGFLQVAAVILIPVAVGVIIGRVSPRFAARMTRPVGIASAIAAVLALAAAIATNIPLLVDNLGALAFVTVLFCALSLTIGYLVAVLLKLPPATATANGFEVGLHNATFAIVVAQTALHNIELSTPAAVYGVLMSFVAVAFGLIARRVRSSETGSPARDDVLASSE